MKKPAKITLAQAEKLARRDHPGLWETLTPEERREAVHKLNVERGAVKPKVSEAEAFIRRQMRRPSR